MSGVVFLLAERSLAAAHPLAAFVLLWVLPGGSQLWFAAPTCAWVLAWGTHTDVLG